MKNLTLKMTITIEQCIQLGFFQMLIIGQEIISYSHGLLYSKDQCLCTSFN